MEIVWTRHGLPKNHKAYFSIVVYDVLSIYHSNFHRTLLIRFVNRLINYWVSQVYSGDIRYLVAERKWEDQIT